MTTERQQAAIAEFLAAESGCRFAPRHARTVHGGSIHRCVRWPGERDSFVKLAGPGSLATFEAEAAGLEELRGARALRIPNVIASGVAGDHAVLALEWLELSSSLSDDAGVQARLGEGLARQHRARANHFGWRRNNVIGATPQPNDENEDWVRFLREHRLGHMLGLAAANGLPATTLDRGRALLERCGEFFTDYRPEPSLLHGDLWGGNWSALAKTGEPVVFDPAVYYGDREADIAFTHLFGGFGAAFYAAYNAAWPLDAGAAVRRTLYNLYHVLNHHVLFGGGYGRQAAAMIDRLLAEVT